MDQRTRKRINLHKALQPRDDIDKLCVKKKKKKKKKKGERGLASIKDSVDTTIQWLEDYIEKQEGGRLITVTRNNTDNTRNNRTEITRKHKWEEKQFYGRFMRLTLDISHEKTWTWLRKGNLKRETESLRVAAKNNAIRTNHIKARIDRTQQNSRCRLWGDRDGTINHSISVCSKLVQKEFKTRFDWVGKVIQWELCKKFEFDHANKWYMHNQESVLENETHQFLLDFKIQSYHLISTRPYNNPQKTRICRIVNFAVPVDHRVKFKEG